MTPDESCAAEDVGLETGATAICLGLQAATGRNVASAPVLLTLQAA
jgi:hypothetical protein